MEKKWEGSLPPEQEMAWQYVLYTSQNLFVTGNAGTGKTTFLRRVVEDCPKRKVVLAPTGVAAINAGGMTVHSFFQLPLGLFLPDYRHKEEAGGRFRFSKNKLKVIRSLELLVIDEVSMMRADMMDEIDARLRRLRRDPRPFGGVQLLLMGDMQQLPPVIRSEEWDRMRTWYPTPYFYDARVFRDRPLHTVVFKHVFRQTDRHFIELLTAVRNNCLTPEQLARLNQRYVPGFEEEEGYVILATHNHRVQRINRARLEALDTVAYTYEARVEGDFPESMYPQDEVLTLKCGAQVMFTKNDPGKQYVNGTLGEVVDLDEEGILVRTYEGVELPVGIATWENLKYEVDEESKEISTTVEGVFYQFPLKLAWAITIHKSQGLTFDKAVIDAENAFSHGQVYVALSRCRSLEGLVLRSPLSPASIVSDAELARFCARADSQVLDPRDLEEARRRYYLEQLEELFDPTALLRAYEQYLRLLQTVAGSLYPKEVARWEAARPAFLKDLYEVGLRFCRSLKTLVGPDYAASAFLQERVRKASAYFIDKGVDCLVPLMQGAVALSFDNLEHQKLHKQYLRHFIEAAVQKLKLWSLCVEGFRLDAFLQAKARLAVELEEMDDRRAVRLGAADEEETDLFARLCQWRKARARELKVPAYCIINQASLLRLANARPTDLKGIKAVKGVGKKFMEKYAQEVLELLREESL